MMVDELPVLFDYLYGNDALRGGQRNSDAGIHVPRDGGGGPAERLQLFTGGGFDRRRLRRPGNGLQAVRWSNAWSSCRGLRHGGGRFRYRLGRRGFKRGICRTVRLRERLREPGGFEQVLPFVIYGCTVVMVLLA